MTTPIEGTTPRTKWTWYTIPAAAEGAVDIAAEYDITPLVRDSCWIARDVDRLDGERIVAAVNDYDRLRAIEDAARALPEWLMEHEATDALREALR